jgi:hypothetical protein
MAFLPQKMLDSVNGAETLNFQSASRKSALLSAAKKAKLKSNPSRVRFAESVDINGSPLFNVIKFLTLLYAVAIKQRFLSVTFMWHLPI